MIFKPDPALSKDKAVIELIDRGLKSKKPVIVSFDLVKGLINRVALPSENELKSFIKERKLLDNPQRPRSIDIEKIDHTLFNCIEVYLKDKVFWLSQAQLCDLFQKSEATISEHIKNILEERELNESAVVWNFRTSASDGKMYDVNHYNLDAILKMNGRELLDHAGKISHKMALNKSGIEYEKYKEVQRTFSKEVSLKEIEDDIKKMGQLKPPGNGGLACNADLCCRLSFL